MFSFGFIHELWLTPDEDGELLPSCIAFGPSGNVARNLLESGSYCVWMFWANSHVEAMQTYYDYLGFGKYTTDQQWDFERYPENWYSEQNDYMQSL